MLWNERLSRFTDCSKTIRVAARSVVLLALALVAFAGPARAQTAIISGYLSGFDVLNGTGQPAHGFEIQIEGIQPNDLYYTGYGQRYGMGTVSPYATGVYVRWQSPYNATNGFTSTTPAHVGAASFAWQDCYLGGAGYATSGCEALSQGLRYPTPAGAAATGRWLVEDPQSPGTLISVPQPIAIPMFVTYSIAPPTVVSAPPVVVAVVEPPEPPETPETYGDAQWVKVYKTELTREATPDDLSTVNGVVPTDPAHLEVAWDILQASPPSGGNQKQKRTRTQGGISPTTRSVIRRFETYKYTGAYDAITHQVVCADGTCTAPSTGELGDFIGAHNSAINLNPDVLIVSKDGPGSVGGAGGKINCGGTCSTFALNGTVLSVTANPGGAVFTGWGGACSGNALTCSVTVNGATNVTASFKSQYTLSIGRSGSGTVTGTPNGNDRAINCGGNCSAKFTDGTTVSLTATPAAGLHFVNWSGACSGTDQICSVTITKDTSVQANFAK